MESAKCRVVSALIAVVLALGMVPLPSYAASLSPGSATLDAQAQAKDGFVADWVYDVIGSDYAVLVDNTETGETINVIDRDYNTTLTMGYEVAKYDDYGNPEYKQTTRWSASEFYEEGILAWDWNSVDAYGEPRWGFVGYDGNTIIDAIYGYLLVDPELGRAVGIASPDNSHVVIDLLSLESGARIDRKVLASYSADVLGLYYSYLFSNGSDGYIQAHWMWRGNETEDRYMVVRYTFDGLSIPMLDDKPYDDAYGYFLQYYSAYDENWYPTGESQWYTQSGKRIDGADGFDVAYGYLGDTCLIYNGPLARLVDRNGVTKANFDVSSLGNYSYSTWYVVGDYVVCQLLDESYEYQELVFSADGSPVKTLYSEGSPRVERLDTGHYLHHYSRYDENSDSWTDVVTAYSSDFSSQVSWAELPLGVQCGKLVDGTLLYYASKIGFYVDAAETNGIVTVNKSKVTKNGRTIAQPSHRTSLYQHNQGQDFTAYPASPQHGTDDVFCATDESGNYGAMDSDGNAVVPFEYQGFFGDTDSSLVMVKKDGAWHFYDLQRGAVVDEATALEDPSTHVVASGATVEGAASAGESVRLTVGQPADADLTAAAAGAKGEAAGRGADYVGVFDVKLDVVDGSGSVVRALTDGLDVTLSFPVGEAYDGRAALVTQIHDGAALAPKGARVSGGRVSVRVSQLSEFVVEVQPEQADEPGGSDEAGGSTEAGSQSMHRLYNPNSGEHFYTASDYERDHLVGVGWKSEGEGWNAPVEGADVYRMYNPNAGDHHYTMSEVERDHLVSVGWKYEGVGWKSAGEDGVPLYRQYNPNARAGSHNYTTSKAENDHLASVGWKEEGISWYGL